MIKHGRYWMAALSWSMRWIARRGYIIGHPVPRCKDFYHPGAYKTWLSPSPHASLCCLHIPGRPILCLSPCIQSLLMGIFTVMVARLLIRGPGTEPNLRPPMAEITRTGRDDRFVTVTVNSTDSLW